MTESNSQVPWSDEQWDRVKRAIEEEANRARVAANFLPLFGPLPASADFVRREEIKTGGQIAIDDIDTIRLVTLQVKVQLRGAQMSDPDLTSALALFRRAANLLARLEDALIFNGQAYESQPPAGGPPNIWEVRGGQRSRGLLAANAGFGGPDAPPSIPVPADDGDCWWPRCPTRLADWSATVTSAHSR